MDMNNFRSEFHVAQQSRRDKLRSHINPYNHHHHLPAGSSSYDFSDLPTTARNDYTWETLPTQPNPDHSSWVSVVRGNPDYQTPSCYDPTISIAKPYENEAYHNALQELVRSSEETGDNPWVGNGNGNGGGELLLLPTYNDRIGGPTPTDAPRWNGELHPNTQALSLTLSSVPSPKAYASQIGERSSRALTHQTPGPLGPFTGYATILRSSRFLRPAQMLLDELCCVARPMNFEICEESGKVLEDVRVSGEGVCSVDLGGPFSIGFNNERSLEVGWMDSCRPESLHKKSKLLYMQDEVSRKYKQYQQQMQMVVSSFESVEGLAASTPYVSLALKMVSKNFRSLKNSISDQLKSIGNALGEELSSPPGSKGGSMLKFFDQSFQKQRGSNNNNSNNINVLDGQHIWRPQRGLPERAVSILRAWLFDHFLHPYPTDTDKHMLATQTGLTRNQVSNWFINARVRVWKPMVEEIHMLETKGMSEACSDEKTPTPNMSTECDQGQCSNTARGSKMMDDYSIGDYQIGASWNQDKRSRIEYGVPTGVVNDGSVMGLMPAAHQAVSLTLGLRQGAENGQRQQHYGGQFRRDFVG